jgi:hypothetical protein
MEWVPGNPNDRSVRGFRIRHGGSRGPMSVTLYNKLKREGRGARETVVGTTISISPEDEKAWDDARANPTDPTELESIAKTRARWHKRALAAGAAAARSPNHVSKLKLGGRKRPPPRAGQSKR